MRVLTVCFQSSQSDSKSLKVDRTLLNIQAKPKHFLSFLFFYFLSVVHRKNDLFSSWITVLIQLENKSFFSYYLNTE